MTADPIAACAELVRKGDPDRFLATMAAPVSLRERLFPLYAYNLEIARAPWVTKEPMIAEMRLQWWRDVIADPTRKAHEVAGPLHDTIRAGAPVTALDAMAAARRHDVWGDAFADRTELLSYLNDTGAALMWAAAAACGAPPFAEETARNFGLAAAAAGYLRALPELAARNKPGLPADTTPADLARHGLTALQNARKTRRTLGPAAPVLLSAWLASPILSRVATGQDPDPPEFTRRGRLLWASLTGRV
jgi:phytoene/squalene synthetase